MTVLRDESREYGRVQDDHAALMREAIEGGIDLNGAAGIGAAAHSPGAWLRLEDPRDLARGSLSSEQIAAAWERGRATPIEAAVALAREELAAEGDG